MKNSKQVARRLFCAILMDLRMPVMNGYKLANPLSGAMKSGARHRHVRDAYAEDIRKSAHAGMNAHIVKSSLMWRRCSARLKVL